MLTAVLERIDELDARLRSLETQSAVVDPGVRSPLPSAPSPAPAPAPAPPTRPAVQIPALEPAPAKTAPVSSEAALKWSGVGLVVLAAVFFVSTAIQRGWIGPWLQFALAFAAGLGLLAASEWFRTRRTAWSLAFAHGGIAALGLVSAVGAVGLELYSSATAAVLIAGAAAASIAMAVHLGRASVAGTGVAVAIFAPLIAGTPFDYDAHYSAVWVGALAVVFTAVAVAKRWVSLRLTTFLLTVLPLMAAMLAIAEADEGRAALVVGSAVIFVSVVAYLAGLLGVPALRPPEGADAALDLAASVDERLLGLIPGIAWVCIALIADYENDNVLSYVAWGLAALFAGVFLVLRRSDRIDERRFAAGLVGCSVIATVGLVGLIEGPSLLVALTMQALGVGWLARRYRDIFLVVNAGVLAAVAALWSIGGMLDAAESGATAGEHSAHLLVVLTIAGLAFFAHGDRSDKWLQEASGPLAIAAFAGWLLWLLSVLGELPQGQMAVSIAWAASGAAVLLAGLFRTVGSFEARPVANLGLATLAVTVLKLVTVDLDRVDTIWRAALFFVVGLGLLRLGLLIGGLDGRDSDDDAGTPSSIDGRPPASAQ